MKRATTMKQLNNNILNIYPSSETNKITSFIKKTLEKEGFKNVVIGMSGGIDSTTSFYLLREALAPENIIVAHLYYFRSQFKDIKPILKESKIPKENIYEISIAPMVRTFQSHLEGVVPQHLRGGPLRSEASQMDSSKVNRQHHLGGGRLERSVSRDSYEVNRVRLGNIMARIRMIILFDLAKKHNGLVAGTENKSEFLLGYFTRHGDEASDFEPIQHLYKTQVVQLAKYLQIPKTIIDKTPTAGLWEGQSDEGEFGFSYKEADNVLYLYFEKKMSVSEISKKGFQAAKKIISWVDKNSFKHKLPYKLNSKHKITNIN